MACIMWEVPLDALNNANPNDTIRVSDSDPPLLRVTDASWSVISWPASGGRPLVKLRTCAVIVAEAAPHCGSSPHLTPRPPQHLCPPAGRDLSGMVRSTTRDRGQAHPLVAHTAAFPVRGMVTHRTHGYTQDAAVYAGRGRQRTIVHVPASPRPSPRGSSQTDAPRCDPPPRVAGGTAVPGAAGITTTLIFLRRWRSIADPPITRDRTR